MSTYVFKSDEEGKSEYICVLFFGEKWWSLDVWMEIELLVVGWKFCNDVRISCSKVWLDVRMAYSGNRILTHRSVVSLKPGCVAT